VSKNIVQGQTVKIIYYQVLKTITKIKKFTTLQWDDVIKLTN